MRSECLYDLMCDREMHEAAKRAARRYTKCPEDIEEYESDIWMRISDCPEDKTTEYYEREMRRAARALYQQRYRERVYTDVNGISESGIPKRKPRNAVPLGHHKFLVRKPEKLSQWYYDGEWKDYGLDKDAVQVRTFYEIVVST